MRPREQDIQRECLIWLNQNGWFAWQNPTIGVYDVRAKQYRKPGAFAIRGVSDCIAIHNTGVVVFFEFKRGFSEQTDQQRLFEKQVKKNNGHYFVIRSLGEMQDAIRTIGI